MLCRDAALADDLLQESYLRWLRAKISDANEFQMKAYLYKTAVSLARDHWRAGKRVRACPEEIPPESGPADHLDLSYDVNGLFRKLDRRQQALLWLAYVEGFRHREIAEVMNVGEKSVRVMLSRARKQLTGMLNQAGLGPKERA
jgi:RNA polymerase sigma-70 factor (ECF subfamily)